MRYLQSVYLLKSLGYRAIEWRNIDKWLWQLYVWVEVIEFIWGCFWFVSELCFSEIGPSSFSDSLFFSNFCLLSDLVVMNFSLQKKSGQIENHSMLHLVYCNASLRCWCCTIAAILEDVGHWQISTFSWSKSLLNYEYDLCM